MLDLGSRETVGKDMGPGAGGSSPFGKGSVQKRLCFKQSDLGTGELKVGTAEESSCQSSPEGL